jgi:hypothetical protein
MIIRFIMQFMQKNKVELPNTSALIFLSLLCPCIFFVSSTDLPFVLQMELPVLISLCAAAGASNLALQDVLVHSTSLFCHSNRIISLSQHYSKLIFSMAYSTGALPLMVLLLSVCVRMHVYFVVIMVRASVCVWMHVSSWCERVRSEACLLCCHQAFSLLLFYSVCMSASGCAILTTSHLSEQTRRALGG